MASDPSSEREVGNLTSCTSKRSKVALTAAASSTFALATTALTLVVAYLAQLPFPQRQPAPLTLNIAPHCLTLWNRPLSLLGPHSRLNRDGKLRRAAATSRLFPLVCVPRGTPVPRENGGRALVGTSSRAGLRPAPHAQGCARPPWTAPSLLRWARGRLRQS